MSIWISQRPASRRPRPRRRSEVLEVKAQRRGGAPAWRRVVVALLFAAVAFLALHTGLRSWGTLRDGFLLSPRFFGIEAIVVNTNLAWLTPAEVLRWSGVKPGDNLLTVNLDRVKRDLELIPQVEQATVERVLPRVLRLHIRERVPVAQVRVVQADQGRLTPAVFFLDSHARVMPPLTAGRGNAAALTELPLLTGLRPYDLRLGNEVNTPGVRAALDLIRVFPGSALAGQTALKAIDVAEPDVLLATTADGAQVTLALTRLDPQLTRWRLVRDAGARQGRTIRLLDLSITNNCPVIWNSPDPTPVVLPRPAGRSPTPARHV